MATRNAKSRPHCVDIAPSAYAANANRENRNASYSSPARFSGASSKTTRDSKSGSNGGFRALFAGSTTQAGTPKANTSGTNLARTLSPSSPRGRSHRQPDIYTGAVRLSAGDSHSGSTHFGKLAIALLLISGGVIWTTVSSDSLITTSTDRPETLHAAVLPPAFFFDDDSNALEHNLAKINTSLSATQAKPKGTDQNPAISDNVVAMVTPGSTSILTGTNDHSTDTTDSTDTTEKIQPQSAAVETVPETVTTPIAEIAQQPTVDKSQAAPDKDVVETVDTDVQIPGSRRITVSPGDTLSAILNENGLKADQLNQLLTHTLVKDHLSSIDVGQLFELELDDTGHFQTLTTRVGKDLRVNIERTALGFDVTTVDLPIERRRVSTSGKIEQSLYLAAEKANLKQSTIMELANIFQWELDFARDIRQGDSFSLVYDRLFREGKYIGDGNILAAEFVRGGKAYTAIRFTDEAGVSGYYSPDGQSKRRTFMRHPVDVVRITSRFNPNRLHPVLHQIRAHRGVDYGSPHGSPIYATADGKVIYSGNKNAYGKTVVLKHGEKFSTLYAHMSRISGKSQVGKRVKQGDVIGYVGKTGRVTGTHLHYEFRVNGIQIDPLKVELPAASPIAKKYRGDLAALSEEMSKLMKQARQESEQQIAAAPVQ